MSRNFKAFWGLLANFKNVFVNSKALLVGFKNLFAGFKSRGVRGVNLKSSLVKFKSAFVDFKSLFANFKSPSVKPLERKKPVRVLIFGSCVSRDIFEFAEQGEFEIVRYYARSSLASLSGEAFSDEKSTNLIQSAFQRRCAIWDLNKDFLDFVKKVEFDILLFDLIDDRFHLYKHSNSHFATLSVGYKEALQYKNSSRVIHSCSEDFIKLWQLGLKKFKEAVKNIEHKIIINKPYFSNTLTGGGGIEMSINYEELQRMNKYLNDRYKELDIALPQARSITYPKNLLRLDPHHHWGLSAVHYTKKTYEFALEQIANFTQEQNKIIDEYQLTEDIQFTNPKDKKDLEQTYEQECKNKSIAIIVPIYNVEKYLSECIESILSQSHKNFKLFLIDDESSDTSLEIALNYAKKDKRIFVFSQQNSGQGSARNIGILVAGSRLKFKKLEELKADLNENKIAQLLKEEQEFEQKGFKLYFYYENKKLIKAFVSEEVQNDFKKLNATKEQNINDLFPLFADFGKEFTKSKNTQENISEKKEESISLWLKQVETYRTNIEYQSEVTPNFDYLCFVDSDDFIKPHTLKNYLFYIRGADFLYAGFEYFFDGLEKDENLKTHFQNYKINKEGMISAKNFIDINLDSDIRSFPFVYQGMINHSLIYEGKFLYPWGIYAEDLLFGVLLIALSQKIYVLQESFYVYRIRKNSSQAYDDVYKAPPRFARLLKEFDDDFILLKNYLHLQSSLNTASKLLNFCESCDDKERARQIKEIFIPTYVFRAKNVVDFPKDPLDLKMQFYHLRKEIPLLISGASARLKNQLSYKLGFTLIKKKSPLAWIFLPLSLIKCITNHRFEARINKIIEQRFPKNTPPLSPFYYRDFGAYLRTKKHLSYQIGFTLVHSFKSVKGVLILPIKLYKISKNYRKKR